jgi:hypothetical protein
VGTNRFSYSFNDPVNKFDPGGNQTENDVFKDIVGAFSGRSALDSRSMSDETADTLARDVGQKIADSPPVSTAITALGVGADFMPLLGGAKGFYEATAWSGKAAAVGLEFAGPLGDAARYTARGVNALADRLRGLSRHGVEFTSSANGAGGTLHTSVGAIDQTDVSGIVNKELIQGNDVRVVTGVHGAPDGSTVPDSGMLDFDKSTYGGISGVTVHDFNTMTPEDLRQLLSSPGATIGAFCNSGACFSKLLGE